MINIRVLLIIQVLIILKHFEDLYIYMCVCVCVCREKGNFYFFFKKKWRLMCRERKREAI